MKFWKQKSSFTKKWCEQMNGKILRSMYYYYSLITHTILCVMCVYKNYVYRMLMVININITVTIRFLFDKRPLGYTRKGKIYNFYLLTLFFRRVPNLLLFFCFTFKHILIPLATIKQVKKQLHSNTYKHTKI